MKKIRFIVKTAPWAMVSAYLKCHCWKQCLFNMPIPIIYYKLLFSACSVFWYKHQNTSIDYTLNFLKKILNLFLYFSLSIYATSPILHLINIKIGPVVFGFFCFLDIYIETFLNNFLLIANKNISNIDNIRDNSGF